MATLRVAFLLAACCASATRLIAQGDELAAGIRAAEVRDLGLARTHFELALHRDPKSYEAGWRLALVLIDIAKQTPDRVKSPARDSMYALAESYAHRAVTAKPEGAEGHFVLANAVGRAALSKSAKERVRRAGIVRSEAIRAIELDPRHDGAWHILGRWNAEIMRLSALERFFAKTFLGAAVFSAASWDEAERDLHLAIQYAPSRVVHHFDLAEILVSRKEWSAARQQLELVASLPISDVSDTSYKRQARELMPRVLEKLRK